MHEATGQSREVVRGATPTAPVPAAESERVLLLECRLEQFRSALGEARADADRARARLAEAAAREADHARRYSLAHQELAETRAEIVSLQERLGRSEALRAEVEGHLFEAGAHDDAAELVRLRREVLAQRQRSLVAERTSSRLRARMNELLLSRETLLTRITEWQRLVRKESPDAVDLAEFMAELRRDILHLEHRNASGERREAMLRERLVLAGVDPDAPLPEDNSVAPTADAERAGPEVAPRTRSVRAGVDTPAASPEHRSAASVGVGADRGPDDPEVAAQSRPVRAKEAGRDALSDDDRGGQVGDLDGGQRHRETAGTDAPSEASKPGATEPVDDKPSITVAEHRGIDSFGSAPPASAETRKGLDSLGAGLSITAEEGATLARPEARPPRAARPGVRVDDVDPAPLTAAAEANAVDRVPVVATVTTEDVPVPPASEPEEPTRTAGQAKVEGLQAVDPAARAAAYGRLTRLDTADPSQLADHFRSGLTDPHPRVRRRAVLAAATTRHLALHPLLDPLRADPDPQVRRVVREVLRHAPAGPVVADDREGPVSASARAPSATPA